MSRLDDTGLRCVAGKLAAIKATNKPLIKQSFTRNISAPFRFSLVAEVQQVILPACFPDKTASPVPRITQIEAKSNNPRMRQLQHCARPLRLGVLGERWLT